ncbi:hypothetical protein ACERK3_19535 [Phycisphaerales bacterium AB-hyl4]|uniref:Uncharacterized protein n=1 Tax=Natronomicrosphaera hydrolytica TaxID=3242702 RepID=A0ABV4UA29_9BACT
MIDPTWLGLGIALPLALGAAGALLPTRCLGWALAVLCAMVTGYLARSGLPRIPPNQAHQWLLVVGVPTVVVAAVVVSRLRLQPAMGWVVRGVVAVGLPPLLLQAHLRYHWDRLEAVTWLIGLSAAVLLCWWAMHGVARRGGGFGGRALPMVLAITAAGTSVATLLSYNFTQAQWTMTLAAVLLGGGLVVLAFRFRHGLTGAVDVALPLVLAMVMMGRFHTTAMTNVQAGLLAGAPLAAAWAHWPGGRWLLGMAGWRLELVRLAAAVALVAAAMVLALVQWLGAR